MTKRVYIRELIYYRNYRRTHVSENKERKPDCSRKILTESSFTYVHVFPYILHLEVKISEKKTFMLLDHNKLSFSCIS